MRSLQSHREGAVNCSSCGRAIPDTESWPDEQGPICQTCWEAVCAAAWWQAVEG